MGEKVLKWEGSSRRDLCNFVLVHGEMLGVVMASYNKDSILRIGKPLHSIGADVREIGIHEGSEYRVIYVANFRDAIYVLHAIHKGAQRTPERDLEFV